MALLALLAACSGGRGHGGDPYYDDPYGYGRGRTGGSRVDPAALERHQEGQRKHLERQQDNAREQLLRQQRRDRREQKQAGEWDAGDKQEQGKARRQQSHRFEQQDRRLRKQQEYERDLYE